jgi:hypothetical protein
MMEILSATEDKQRNLVFISINLPDRELAAGWANALVAAVNAAMRAREVAEAQQSVAYLKVAAQQAETLELKSVIYGVIETQINREMLANVQNEFAFKIVDPATAPDIEDYAWPRYPVLGIAGFVLGSLAAILVTVLWLGIRRRMSP